jgi:hypothetical protein
MSRFISISIVLVVCITSAAIQSQSQNRVGTRPGEIGPSSAWNPPQIVWQRMQSECSGPALVECSASVMKEAGAPAEAIAFARFLKGEGYMDSFREMGQVDLATAFFPFRANENGTFFLVNGAPAAIDVNDWDNLKSIDIRRDTLYPVLIRKYPNLELFPSSHFDAMKRTPMGGQRFIFKFILVNGCHACFANSYAHVAFDFELSGRFLGTRLLRLSRAVPSRGPS